VIAWPKGLLPGHQVSVVGVGVDEYAIRIDYEIQPAITLGLLAWPSAAEDDVGTSYLPAGGACGASEDGDITLRTLSTKPPPPVEASTIRIRFAPLAGSETHVEAGDGPAYELLIDVSNTNALISLSPDSSDHQS
jgi:hypothetical protein